MERKKRERMKLYSGIINVKVIDSKEVYFAWFVTLIITITNGNTRILELVNNTIKFWKKNDRTGADHEMKLKLKENNV